MKFDGLIFDVDGTIWNTTSVVAKAWNKVIDNYFPNESRVCAEVLKGQFGKTMDVIADNLFPNLTKEQKHFLINKCCDEEQIALENCKDDLTYSGMKQTIITLSKKYPIFIVSNCQKGYIEIVVQKTGIDKYIKDFECFGNTLKGKDENIKILCQRNDLKNPVYIGDTNGDYEACKKANVPFVWASYGFGKPEDNNYYTKVEEFSDLENLFS